MLISIKAYACFLEWKFMIRDYVPRYKNLVYNMKYYIYFLFWIMMLKKRECIYKHYLCFGIFRRDSLLFILLLSMATSRLLGCCYRKTLTQIVRERMVWHHFMSPHITTTSMWLFYCWTTKHHHTASQRYRLTFMLKHIFSLAVLVIAAIIIIKCSY